MTDGKLRRNILTISAIGMRMRQVQCWNEKDKNAVSVIIDQQIQIPAESKKEIE